MKSLKISNMVVSANKRDDGLWFFTQQQETVPWLHKKLIPVLIKWLEAVLKEYEGKK